MRGVSTDQRPSLGPSSRVLGGSIELGILGKYFDVEIVSIDVETSRIDKYNEGSRRCILVYSGVSAYVTPSNNVHSS